MSQEPLDVPAALERIGGEMEFLWELLEIFQDDFRDKIGRLKDAVKSKDFNAVQNIGHALKGASANLSLLPLQAACKKMEEAGRSHEAQASEEALGEMEKEFERLLSFLRDLQKKES